jgi:hypothetical protein
MSLSMVLGMPTTLIFKPRCRISSAIAWAPRSVPSPPIVKRMPMFMRSSVSTISPMSWWPRDDPRIVPPYSWMRLTASGFSSTGAWPKR